MQFTFIAVNFNGAEHTANYLKSLAKMSIPLGDAVEAIIVDNNSADDDLERVKRGGNTGRCPDIHRPSTSFLQVCQQLFFTRAIVVDHPLRLVAIEPYALSRKINQDGK